MGFAIEQLPTLNHQRLAGRDRIIELFCTPAAVFREACEDASTAFLRGFAFVGRAFCVRFLFDQRFDRVV